MEEFVIWFENNLELIIAGSGITTLITYFMRKISNQLMPSLVLMFKNVIVTVFSQGFGCTTDESESLMEKLPVVSTLEQLAEDLRVQNEIKILEYEHKLNSPIYTEEEKAKFQEALNILMSRANSEVQNLVTETIDTVKDAISR